MTLEVKRVPIAISGTTGSATVSINGTLKEINYGDESSGYTLWVNSEKQNGATAAILEGIAVSGASVNYPSIELEDPNGAGRSVYREHVLSGKVNLSLVAGSDGETHTAFLVYEKTKG